MNLRFFSCGISLGLTALMLFHGIYKLIEFCYPHSYHLGVELLTQSDVAGEALLKMLWHYQDAILCCSFKVYPKNPTQNF